MYMTVVGVPRFVFFTTMVSRVGKLSAEQTVYIATLVESTFVFFSFFLIHLFDCHHGRKAVTNIGG